MYPHERSLVKKFQGKPFVILAVNSDPKDRLKKLYKEKTISWRAWWDGGNPSGPIATSWNVRGWPTIYVLDAKGVIRYRDVREQALEKAVEKLLAEAEKK
jgi:hypothetical protein